MVCVYSIVFFCFEYNVFCTEHPNAAKKQQVIISCVRANQDLNIGHLRDMRRMNVALSRAKERIIVVGSIANFGKQARMHKRWSSLARRWQKDPPSEIQDALANAASVCHCFFSWYLCKGGPMSL